MFRADRLDGKEQVEGDLLQKEDKCYIVRVFKVGSSYSDLMRVDYDWMESQSFSEIKPETLEIYLFGEWRLVADLEEKFVLLDKEHSEKLHDMTYDFATGKTDGEELVKYVHQKIKG